MTIQKCSCLLLYCTALQEACAFVSPSKFPKGTPFQQHVTSTAPPSSTLPQISLFDNFPRKPASLVRSGLRVKNEVSLDENSSNGTVPSPLEAIELTDDKIYEMLELTFIKSCLQLATGYVDVLKLFLASTIAAYERNISIPTLTQSVADCPTNTANRPLSNEEVDLRSGWITLAYLTVETINRLENKEVNDLSIPEDIRETYGGLVDQKVKQRLGLLDDDVDNFKEEAVPTDPQAAAIFAYNIKVIELTISNIEEAKVANEGSPTIDEDGIGPPRPKIPGAY